MAVGTAIPDNLSEGWQSPGYKCGSEPSVMNLSGLLQDQAGKWGVVASGWQSTRGFLELRCPDWRRTEIALPGQNWPVADGPFMVRRLKKQNAR